MKVQVFPFNMFQVNTFVVWDETNEAVIIDAGCIFPNEQQQLAQLIAENRLSVKRLLCTHLHLDHVFGNNFVERTYGIKAEAMQEDTFLLDTFSEQCRMFGFDAPDVPAPITQFLKEGDLIRFGNSEFRALHVPGHSPGSMAFYCAEHALLFSGDCLFLHNIGRTDLVGGSYPELRQSIINQLFTLPEETTVYTGHGPSTTIGEEKHHNPFF